MDPPPPASFACKCLNVRIHPAPNPPSAPEVLQGHPSYFPVHVGDDGINIAHLQLTVRNRLPAFSSGVPPRTSRFTVLTCLVCDIPVYRVVQSITPDIDGNDGPLLPTEEWVEREVMKSASGWIEVHKDSLTGKALLDAESSPNYSNLFSLAIPEIPTSPPSSPRSSELPDSNRPSSPLSSSLTPTAPSPPATPSYLSELRPLFLPPPFTPSHPVFLHLLSLAEKESQVLRAASEQRIAQVKTDEIAKLDRAEGLLKRQVETLWKTFRENVSHLQQPKQPTPSSQRNPLTRTRDGESTGASSPAVGSPLAVRDFVPVVASRRLSPPPVPRISALSASLATSSFHHPRARNSEPNGSPKSFTSKTLSTSSGSPTLVSSQPADINNVFRFKRNINDTINTSATYRYFVNLEEDMARHKREREKLKQENGDQTQQAGPSQLPDATAKPSVNGTKKHPKANEESQAEEDEDKNNDEHSPSPGKDSKGKRKVTFDVKPAVMRIKRETDPKNETVPADSRDMIFDLDDLDLEEVERSPRSRPTLPLKDQPVINRPWKLGRARMQGLPESFAALRPTSLPAPSHMRPPRSQPGVDSSSNKSMLMSLPRTDSAPIRRLSADKEAAAQPLSPRDAEILKLVAADTPSHRGAWTPESKAWQTFTRRHDSKDQLSETDIPEEGEGDNSFKENLSGITQPLEFGKVDTLLEDDFDYDEEDEEEYDKVPPFANVGIPGSMPINIRVRPVREPLSIASYQPKNAIPEEPATSTSISRKIVSSASIRKASYAERDRSRSMDPGALDFATEEDDEDEEESDIDVKPEAEGGRGRKRALKILEARSEIPDAGMWRSLAS